MFHLYSVPLVSRRVVVLRVLTRLYPVFRLPTKAHRHHGSLLRIVNKTGSLFRGLATKAYLGLSRMVSSALHFPCRGHGTHSCAEGVVGILTPD